MARGEELTDEQWAVIEPHLPELPGREDGRGRPWRENREVMDGILWILRSGARWKDLPARFPPYQTCHRRFQQWVALPIKSPASPTSWGCRASFTPHVVAILTLWAKPQWVRDGSLRRVLEALAEDLRARGDLDLSECFIDGTFIVAKKGGTELVRLSGAKARNSWWWQTLMVFLSPPTRRVLRRMKSPLSGRHSFGAFHSRATA